MSSYLLLNEVRVYYLLQMENSLEFSCCCNIDKPNHRSHPKTNKVVKYPHVSSNSICYTHFVW